MCFANIVEREDGEPIWLTISDAEQGFTKMRCEAGKSYTFAFEPSDGWRLHSVTYRGADVTTWLNADGEFTTPPMSQSAVLNIAYESVADEVKVFNDATCDVRVNVRGREITASGIPDGTELFVYDLGGALCGSAVSSGGEASVRPMLPSGSVAVVKVGGKSVKVRVN